MTLRHRTRPKRVAALAVVGLFTALGTATSELPDGKAVDDVPGEPDGPVSDPRAALDDFELAGSCYDRSEGTCVEADRRSIRESGGGIAARIECPGLWRDNEPCPTENRLRRCLLVHTATGSATRFIVYGGTNHDPAEFDFVCSGQVPGTQGRELPLTDSSAAN